MITFFNSLNCYTDASLIKLNNGVTCTCSGYVMTYDRNIVDQRFKIVYDSTNNYGEILAIYMGLNALMGSKGYDGFKNLFSDSLISVKGLRSWIFSWVRNMTFSRGNRLINSEGKEVANQEIFSAIVSMIATSTTPIAIWHQRGHQNSSSVKSMKLLMDTFKRENHNEITEDMAREMIYFNNVVDTTTRDLLTRTVNDPNFNPSLYKRPLVVVSTKLTLQLLSKYSQLLG